MVYLSKVDKFLLILLLLILAYIFQWESLQDYPLFTHAWAQSDRYAIALKFLDNGMNFFKPESYLYSLQFPDDFWTKYDDTITAVDFPIHDYMAAIGMKIFDTRMPWVFKTYSLLYSLIGFYFLFKAVFLISKSKIQAFFVMIFALSSPVLLFYQAGFLPGIPSLANALIGFYFLIKFLKTHQLKSYVLTVVFLTLATLARTTFLIPLLSFFGLTGLLIVFKKISLKGKIIPTLLSLSCIFSYAKYNDYLREQYGSVFLNVLLPSNGWEHFKELTIATYENWFYQYFSQSHYLVLSIAILIIAWSFIRKKASTLQQQIALFILILFTGNVAFFIAMTQQFPHHDYYFLDTFYLPIVLLFALGINMVPQFKFKKSVLTVVTIFLAFFWINNGVKSQEERRVVNEWDELYFMVKDYKGAEEFMDENNVPKDARLLVLEVIGPNYPFIFLNRNGYYMRSQYPEKVKNTLTWNPPYIVFQSKYKDKLLDQFPQIKDAYQIQAASPTLILMKQKLLNESD